MKQLEEETESRGETLTLIYNTIGFQGLAASNILAFKFPAWVQQCQNKSQIYHILFFAFKDKYVWNYLL